MAMTNPMTSAPRTSEVWEALDSCKQQLVDAGDAYNVSDVLLYTIIRDWANRNLTCEQPYRLHK